MLKVTNELNGWRRLYLSVWLYLRKLLKVGEVYKTAVSVMELLDVEGMGYMKADVMRVFQSKAIKNVVLCTFFIMT